MGKSQGVIRPYQGTLSFLLRMTDSVIVIALLYFSTVWNEIDWHDRYSFVAVTAIALLTFFTSKFDIYRSWRFARIREEVLRLWLAWFITAAALLTLTFILGTTQDYSRHVLAEWFVITGVALALWRIMARSFLHEMRRKGFNSRTAAILGANTLGERLALRMNGASWMGLRFCGFYDDRTSEGGRIASELSEQVRGNLDDLLSAARNGAIDIVYIAYPLRAETRIREFIRKLSDTTVSVYVVPDFNAFEMLYGRWFSFGELPVVSIFENPHSGIDGWVKRIEDIVLSTLILALIAIPMSAIAIAVKLTSNGPVLFKQRRYGIAGREIVVWKFRTMTVMEDGPEIRQATATDSRVTPLGRFLRRTSLDELPQFFNVLKGDMSIVGPRPHAVAHNEEYRKLIDGYMLRHKVKPGITGLAQVNGYRGETEVLEKMSKRVHYDLEYIRNWSLLLDLKLIALTLLKGFGGRNAY